MDGGHIGVYIYIYVDMRGPRPQLLFDAVPDVERVNLYGSFSNRRTSQGTSRFRRCETRTQVNTIHESVNCCTMFTFLSDMGKQHTRYGR